MYDLFTEMEVVDGVTVIRIYGNLSVEGLVGVSTCGFYGLTRQAIWDLSGSSLAHLDRDKYVRLSSEFKARQDTRKTLSVGIVLDNETDLHHFRYYTLVSAHQTGHKTRQFLTCDVDDAWAWLRSVEDVTDWRTVEHDVPMLDGSRANA